MARNVEEIIKEQMGNMMLQLSIVQSQLETEREAHEKLKAEVERSKEAAKPMKEVK